MRIEAFIEITAAGGWKAGVGCSPRVIGLEGCALISNTLRNRKVVSSPEPDADKCACPFDGVPSSADGVEVGPEGRHVGLRLDDTSSVAALA